ncbi:MAG TPA: ATP-binding protein [Frankiaceae bacterium]|nr:ATP-binding protein [Frankiaceae bacterium]
MTASRYRFWRRRWTLRARLLAGLLALLAVTGAVIGIVSVTTLQRQVLSQVDRQVLAASSRSGDAAGGPDHRPPANGGAGGLFNVLGQPAGTLTAELSNGKIDTAGILRGGSLSPTPIPTSDADTLAAVPVDNRPHTITLAGFGDYRVVATPDPDGDGSAIITGLPLKDATSTVTHLAIVIIIVSLAGLLGAAIVGSLIVRFALRPLRRVAETATRVSTLRLDRGEVALSERVPDKDTDERTEVGKVGSALNTMLGHVATALTARQASEMRVRQFVADASHELRTPLASIRGYAELTRRTGDVLPPDIKHAMDRVESEATRMTGLVEDLLLLARLDAGRPVEKELVDLTALVIDAVSDAHAAGPDHPVHLVLPDDPVEILGEPARLHQVLTNLLTNARTHTAPGTRIEVRLLSMGQEAVVEIADSGPGISPDLLPHIFERFARADSSRSRKAGSTGLGLAIVSAVVTAHGGRVEVDTRPGRTVFAVHLPVQLLVGPVAAPRASPQLR